MQQNKFGEVDEEGSKVVVIDVVSPAQAGPCYIHPSRVAADFGHDVGVQASGHEGEGVRDRIAEQPQAGARENGLPEVPGAGWECRDGDCCSVLDKLGVFLSDAGDCVRSIEAAFEIVHVGLQAACAIRQNGDHRRRLRSTWPCGMGQSSTATPGSSVGLHCVDVCHTSWRTVL